MTDDANRRLGVARMRGSIQWLAPEVADAGERVRIVEESYVPGMSVSLIARRKSFGGNRILTWQRLLANGSLTPARAGEEVVLASEYRVGRKGVPGIRAPMAIKPGMSGVDIRYLGAKPAYQPRVGRRC